MKRLLLHPIHCLAFGFGSGLAAKAPGTFGTLAAIPLVYAMQFTGLLTYTIITLIASIGGLWICGYTARTLGVHDHPAIVWDEIAGYMIAMIALPFTWYNVLGAFILFRFLDIVKPGPIGWCDRHLKGGAGIMVDDLLAGAASAIVLHGVHALLDLSL
ncbi:phosphatidylglycerophosphatase A family protein [Pseudidiomarina andamanensis]|uniref:Phosphatidylglycerophosphatase A n=1 Tax=Pseudidiomarina andamanensis TaxID=1940690 RepID=A0AA92ILW0_9GAMM|nr:phosphatidylglycerophosphatase A [Pseudidiomarina andamanensis]MDS0219567.1 phosphatidylglycerophosphatase A [Pseudidiomarina andamanensis]QGT95803.1 phosphatidylglycerophosphatase A [Pseudidiomarina andamanensis]